MVEDDSYFIVVVVTPPSVLWILDGVAVIF